MYENELKHYGVIGMKWGSRKGKTWSSKQTKRAAKRLAQLQAAPNASKKQKQQIRGAKAQLEKNKKLDAEMVKQAKRTSIGKAIVSDLLLGGANEANMRYKAAERLVGKGVSTNTVLNLQQEAWDARKRRARNIGIASAVGGAAVKAASNHINRKRGMKRLSQPVLALPYNNNGWQRQG